MATKFLGAREVAAIKLNGRHSVGGGLYLEVVGSARRWFTRYTFAGKRREIQLGSAKELSLSDARDKAEAIRRQVRDGIDPIEAKKSELAVPVIPTFGAFADELIEALEGGFRNAKHIYQWKQTLGESYCGSIRPKLVSEIDTEAVLSVLKPIWLTKAETAARLRGRIEKVLDAAKAKGLRHGENPARWAGHLASLLPQRSKNGRVHQPAMPYDAVPAFMSRLRARDAVAAKALEFLVLTAARGGEVLGARWSEINQESGIWTIPGERMKAGKEHRIPLTTRALEILVEVTPLRQNASADGYVFPGTKKNRPLSNMAFKQLLVRMGETGFVPHGFRSSFRDWCGECTHFPREVAEAALAHSIGNAVEQAYRRGDALAKRSELMQAWERFLMPSDGKVIAFPALTA